MIRIYQIHVSGGFDEDYYDYIDSSYIDKSKAEARVKELQNKLDKECEQAKKCDNCNTFKEDCYFPLIDDDYDELCENFVDYPQEYYEHETYTIVEREVIE